jgi:hypothetical protein
MRRDLASSDIASLPDSIGSITSLLNLCVTCLAWSAHCAARWKGCGALGAIAFPQGPQKLYQAQITTGIARRADEFTEAVRALLPRVLCTPK